jgi:OFA family oxalate/formate antiporter-like MFS transporter
MKYYQNKTPWIVLFALFFVYVGSNGFGYNTLPLWFPALTAEFKLEKGQISEAPSLMLILVALLSPLFGYLLDKWSAKTMMLCGIFGLSMCFLLFSKISSFFELKIFYTFYALFLCMGGFLPSMFLINKWFDSNRGIAVGIFLNASSLSAIFLNKWAAKLISEKGWREAEFIMATAILTFLVLPWFWIKNNNEKIAQDSLITTKLPDVSLKKIIKTPTFYMLLLVTGTLWFCINGLLFNKDIFLNDLHKTLEERGSFASLFFLCGLIGKIAFGWLSDKFSKKWIMLGSILNLLLGSWLLHSSVSNPEMIKWVAIVYGFGYSGTFTIIQVLVADYYMGRNYGTILGIFAMIDTLAGSAGIALVGKIRQFTGSYLFAFETMIILCVITFIITVFIEKPAVEY